MRPEVIQGDVREVLKTLDEESVQCVVTSPPYWGLRDYGTATWEGGDEDCEHRTGDQVVQSLHGGSDTVGSGVRPGSDNSHCSKCGAKRIDAQLGLEPTPEEYVANMVSVFQEVKRVLRKDGTVWLNLGDSYASGKSRYSSNPQTIAKGKSHDEPMEGKKPDLYYHPVLKDKDLIGIPWRVALALQADGWYIRSDIIWNKPNPMPESVTDRPTKSHEYIFLLTKSAKYYYDHEAIKEKGVMDSSSSAGSIQQDTRITHGTGGGNSGINKAKDKLRVELIERGFTTRNKRSVWKITTKPYKEAHFATFPEELPETCIKAGTKKGDVVLDIFAGSGTTLRVASKLGRKGIGIELNPEYIKILKKRCKIESISLEAFV
jgi:DNA modification methylase